MIAIKVTNSKVLAYMQALIHYIREYLYVYDCTPIYITFLMQDL